MFRRSCLVKQVGVITAIRSKTQGLLDFERVVAKFPLPIPVKIQIGDAMLDFQQFHVLLFPNHTQTCSLMILMLVIGFV